MNFHVKFCLFCCLHTTLMGGPHIELPVTYSINSTILLSSLMSLDMLIVIADIIYAASIYSGLHLPSDGRVCK